MRRFFNPVSLLQSLVAIALVAGCLFAAQWQFSRGANQSATNKIIASNLDLPSLTMNEITDLDAVSNQWRKITLQGSFSQDKQELVRNRYHEGKFGFEVGSLSIEVSASRKKYSLCHSIKLFGNLILNSFSTF